ncbi:uncharacterized protein LOC126846862 [Adelges cooleyi]|uniref:uncharacterized protein LOC126846862 n=1 Tax=Adelges cooleyi TaxID=133065 RepID=UPI00217FA8AD|nr:uncharacterized protein LOC126846862 [Adelges cooleyi]
MFTINNPLFKMFLYPYLMICLCLIPNEIDCETSKDSFSGIVVHDKRWLQFLNSLSLSTPPLTQVKIDQLSGGQTKSKRSQAAYLRKIKELKCVYGGIVQAMFEYLNKVMTNACNDHIPTEAMNLYGIIEAVHIFEQFQVYIAKMFSVLKVANERAFAWMWDVYFMLSMAVETKELGKFVSDFKVDVRLKTVIETFTRSCNKWKHLKPINISIEQHEAVTAEKILGNGLSDVKLAHDQNECPLYEFVYQYAGGIELSKMVDAQLKNDRDFDHTLALG